MKFHCFCHNPSSKYLTVSSIVSLFHLTVTTKGKTSMVKTSVCEVKKLLFICLKKSCGEIKNVTVLYNFL